MTQPIDRPATPEGLFLWVMHRFSEVFEDHAVLKGGMALRLLDSPRHTNDIDYVFVPFTSKNVVRTRIEEVLGEIEGGTVSIEVHSKKIRAEVRVDDAAIQVEANVATECEAIPMATGGFARRLGRPSHVVRIMSPTYALAHKLGAWNERRLLRDLYDVYFLVARAGAVPDSNTLEARLGKIESRLPRLKKRKKMSRLELAGELRQAAIEVTDAAVAQELSGVLPEEELAGLRIRLEAAIVRVAELLEASKAPKE